jgi:hypothetical protein
MVTFTLTHPAGHKIAPPFFGLVDSGADGTIFPMAVMADLGISQADCDELDQMGAGGASKFYCWKTGSLAADFFGRPVNLKVQFSLTPFILLGREDFFSAFRVTFDQRSLRFTVESY